MSIQNAAGKSPAKLMKESILVEQRQAIKSKIKDKHLRQLALKNKAEAGGFTYISETSSDSSSDVWITPKKDKSQ